MAFDATSLYRSSDRQYHHVADVFERDDMLASQCAHQPERESLSDVDCAAWVLPFHRIYLFRIVMSSRTAAPAPLKRRYELSEDS